MTTENTKQEVKQAVKKETSLPGKFSEMKINPKILAKLEALKFTIPTPIQMKTIPLGLEGSDLIGIAQTGTGKTLAFGIPIIQEIIENDKLALIVLPTRELAMQVDEVFKEVGGSLGVKTAILIGGAAFGPQVTAIRRGPNVVIGTPGRILDHLKKDTLRLKACQILVLDEADRMLDMGFAPQIKEILKSVPPATERQTLLFSATMPDDIAAIASKYMRTPVRVEVARAGTVADNIDQEIYFVSKDQKSNLLFDILQKHTGSVLIFTRTKYSAKKVCKELNVIGIKAAEIHSNRSLYQRMEALEGFKKGKYSVLVATDIASRGIDVKGIQLIVNYDLPEDPEDYVHRIGRTGRAGEDGKAISMATHDQRSKIYRIEILTKTKLRVVGKEPPQSSKKMAPYSREKEQEFFQKRHFVNKRRFGNGSYGGRPSSENKPFERKSFGGDKSFGGSSTSVGSSSSSSAGAKPFARKSFGGSSSSSGRSYSGSSSSSSRPASSGRSYSGSSSSSSRPSSSRPASSRPAGSSSSSSKPFARKSFGNSSSSSGRSYSGSSSSSSRPSSSRPSSSRPSGGKSSLSKSFGHRSFNK